MAMGNNGVKVTYIETQFVTSDAASFKSLVQRLTGKSGAEAADARLPHRPRPCRAAAAERTSGVTGAPTYFMSTTAGSAVSAAAEDVQIEKFAANAGDYSELEGLWDYSELFCAAERCHGGSYSDLLY
ncbi:hypothetical protein CFC21_058908 [Triticum aestivum]|uniref:VQ domain-containing protein n=3 Tax=Triticum TaxID=4564 RepID=A0A9R1GP96_WHEAT|nr:hypothetical protein CFC21_007838 [Triticum aestivum]KAF7050554.1 hypothetical protein CFC21_058908 [Triticum aestivum]VAI09500.1 unnamed protein product [Triticum turgidum subsp. durum]